MYDRTMGGGTVKTHINQQKSPKPKVKTVINEKSALEVFGSRTFPDVFRVQRNLIVVSNEYGPPRFSIEYYNHKKERPPIDVPATPLKTEARLKAENDAFKRGEKWAVDQLKLDIRALSARAKRFMEPSDPEPPPDVYHGQTIVAFQGAREGGKFTAVEVPLSPKQLGEFMPQIGEFNPEFAAWLEQRIAFEGKKQDEYIGRLSLGKGEVLRFEPFDYGSVMPRGRDLAHERQTLDSALVPFGVEVTMPDQKPLVDVSGREGELVGVPMGQYAVVARDVGDKKIAHTNCLSGCLGFVLADFEAGVAAAGHANPRALVCESLDEVKADLSGLGGKSYQLYLLGYEVELLPINDVLYLWLPDNLQDVKLMEVALSAGVFDPIDVPSFEHCLGVDAWDGKVINQFISSLGEAPPEVVRDLEAMRRSKLRCVYKPKEK